MNLFENAKVKSKDADKRECLNCNRLFIPDPRNVKRGWGRCCSKHCAAALKFKYNKMSESERVREKRNDVLRALGI